MDGSKGGSLGSAHTALASTPTECGSVFNLAAPEATDSS